MMNSRTRGFTLVELLVVVVLSTVIMTAAYQTLIAQQSSSDRQHAMMGAQGVSRTTLQVLLSELREISPSDRDIIEATATSLTVKSPRKLGIVCQAGDPLVIWEMGDAFEDGEKLRIYDHSTGWWQPGPGNSIGIQSSSSPPSGTCDTWNRYEMDGSLAGTYRTRELSLSSSSSLATIRAGAPVRSFATVTYGLFPYADQYALGRSTNGADPVPLVAPLAPPSDGGLEFKYLDADSVVLSASQANNDPSLIASIEVTVRGQADNGHAYGWRLGGDEGRGIHTERLSASIYLRNNDMGLGGVPVEAP